MLVIAVKAYCNTVAIISIKANNGFGGNIWQVQCKYTAGFTSACGRVGFSFQWYEAFCNIETNLQICILHVSCKLSTVRITINKGIGHNCLVFKIEI